MFKPLIKLLDKHGIVHILQEVIRYLNDNYTGDNSVTKIIFDLECAIRNYEMSDRISGQITDILFKLNKIEDRLITLELNSNDHERRMSVLEHRSHAHEEREDW